METISTYCECSCHTGVDHGPDHQCLPVCARCVFCGRPVKLIFLSEHQAQCAARLALSHVEQRVALRHAAAAS
jgi:hypothetical protein